MTKGFTLLEILIGMAIALVLVAGVLFLQFSLGGTQLEAFRNYVNTSEADSATSRFIREIRTARQSDNGAYPLETLSNFEIVFYSDIDYDDATERVRYTLIGTTLEKGVVEPSGNPIVYPLANETTSTISDNVRNGVEPLFYYYNSDWPDDQVNNPLPDAARLSDTRSIGINLRINSNPNISGNDYDTESTTSIRMLKSN
jgi:prepilin-type N-terminal cleavage/methylation domain-containing protein